MYGGVAIILFNFQLIPNVCYFPAPQDEEVDGKFWIHQLPVGLSSPGGSGASPLGASHRTGSGLNTFQSCFKSFEFGETVDAVAEFFALQSFLRSVKLAWSLPIILASFCQPCVLPFLASANVLTGWKNGLRALCHQLHCWKLTRVSDMLLKPSGNVD